MNNPTAYPLAWPAGKPRTAPHLRRASAFKHNGGALTVAASTDRLEAEVRRLGGRSAILSTNIETTLSGRPKSGRAEPVDPGACLYFTLDGKPMAMACDAYRKVAENIAALAAHIDATRAIARYGVATAAEALQAFQALPPPGPAGRSWRAVLQFPDDCEPMVDQVNARYRFLAAKDHPDAGGSQNAMAELNAARAAALAEVGS